MLLNAFAVIVSAVGTKSSVSFFEYSPQSLVCLGMQCSMTFSSRRLQGNVVTKVNHLNLSAGMLFVNNVLETISLYCRQILT